MSALVRVLPLWTKNPPGVVVSTVAKHSDLSPFRIGPCRVPFHANRFLTKPHFVLAANMENAWQFSKVYPVHTSKEDRLRLAFGKWADEIQRVEIQPEWYTWSLQGFLDTKAHRYPMGKGARPLFSLWNGERLGYIDARKRIYGPLYAAAVQRTSAWKKLVQLYRTESEITLLDYDAHDHRAMNLTLTDVLNDPNRKMGHAFVLAMLLTNDAALDQMAL